VFANRDHEYAARLLGAARVAHRAAHREAGLIAPDDEGRFGGGPYGDADVRDDFYWAAVELWLTTGERAFRDELLGSSFHGAAAFAPDGFDFDRVALPAQLDLAAHPERDVDGTAARTVVAAAEALRALQAQQPWGQPYAPASGWDWGSNGRILNNLVVLAGAHALTRDRAFRDGLAEGLDYLFGRNALGQCYVVGYGTDSTAHLRTRQFGHDLDPAFPPPPRGAVAGGANSKETPGFPSDPRLIGLPPQRCYLDEPTSETTNDLCIRWNAPLAFVATYVDLSTQPVSSQR
jgi:endoglucanase